MGRDVEIELFVEERNLGGGRSVLKLRLVVSGSSPETFTSKPFRRDSLGPWLFEEILPEELRRKLWALRSRIRTARIESREPKIPWEELSFRGPVGELPELPFIARLTVTRPKGGFPAHDSRGRGGFDPPDDDDDVQGGYGRVDFGPSKESPRDGWLGVDDGSESVGVPPDRRGGGDPARDRGDSERAKAVQVTTVVPEIVRPGESFLVEVLFHVEGYEVEASPGTIVEPEVNLSLRDGTSLSIRLVAVGTSPFELDDPEASIEWRPPARKAEFLLTTAREADVGVYRLRLEIWLDRVQLARSYLEIEVDPQAARSSRRRPSRALPRLPRSAFASYCRRDTDRVLDRVAALKGIGVDVFLDCLDIRQGADWQAVLHREIDSRELLLLFWSCAASASEWVEKEWRYALDTRGIDYIMPNALEPPERCPPPKELVRLNFGSVADRIRRDWIENSTSV